MAGAMQEKQVTRPETFFMRKAYWLVTRTDAQGHYRCTSADRSLCEACVGNSTARREGNHRRMGVVADSLHVPTGAEVEARRTSTDDGERIVSYKWTVLARALRATRD